MNNQDLGSALHDILKQFGTDLLDTVKLINYLADYHALASPAERNIIRQIIVSGMGAKLRDETPQMIRVTYKTCRASLIDEYGFNERMTDQVLHAVLVGLEIEMLDDYSVEQLFEKGKELEKNGNAEEALRFYMEGARREDAKCMNKVGMCYDDGYGTEKDAAMAAEYYLKAALKDYAPAQYNIAACYLSGNGVETNNEEALDWMEEAAEQGLPVAMNSLGVMLRDGIATKAQPYEAYALFKKAALAELPDAQYNLACCLKKGEGTTQDSNAALCWFRIAAENGCPEAIKELEKLT